MPTERGPRQEPRRGSRAWRGLRQAANRAAEGAALMARQTGWRVQDYGAAIAWQVAGVVGRGHPAEFERPERPVGPPVVLVPGVYEPWQFLRPLAARLHAHGLRVHVVPGLGFNRLRVPAAAAELGRHLVAADLRGVVLVAHSKGGLIGKLAMLREDPEGRISSMVAINTPFSGSMYARLLPVGALRDFVPTEPTLRAMAAEVTVNGRITSVHSVWDPHIPDGSMLDDAADVVLDMPGHFRPLADPRLEEVLLEILLPAERDPSSAAPTRPSP